MHNLHLKIITPKRIVLEKDIISITAPSSEGDVTVLPRHTHLFSLLIEGCNIGLKKMRGVGIGGGIGNRREVFNFSYPSIRTG